MFNTLFIGKVAHHFKSLDSTNTFAQNLLSKSNPSEGTVIVTDSQVQGKGQLGSSWLSEACQNITASFILYPKTLSISAQFFLTKVVALSICDLLSQYTEKPISIKWPNDIYVSDNKIAGILIQNTLKGAFIKHSIVGIGLNINQTIFPHHLPNPTSLSLETKQKFDLKFILKQLSYFLECRYLQLKQNKKEILQKDYLARLYKYQVISPFQYPNGNSFNGVIQGVNASGQLMVDIDGTIQQFSLKEIQFL